MKLLEVVVQVSENVGVVVIVILNVSEYLSLLLLAHIGSSDLEFLDVPQ